MPCRARKSEPVGAVLGAGEDQRLLHVAPLEQGQEQRRLELLRHRVYRLGDPHGGRGAGAPGRWMTGLRSISRVSVRIGGRHGGAEEQRLPLLRAGGGGSSGSRGESPCRASGPPRPAPGSRARPAWRRACEKWSSSRPGVATMTSTPLRKACSCGPMPTPPKTGAPVIGVCTARSFEILQDLCGELTGRGEDQGPGGAARLADEAVQDRQEEGRGLAAPGHGAGEDVPAGQGGRHRLRLDRGRPGKAELLDSLEETGMELQ